MTTHSSILPGKSHGQRNLVGYSLWVAKRVRHDLVTKQHNDKFKTSMINILYHAHQYARTQGQCK